MPLPSTDVLMQIAHLAQFGHQGIITKHYPDVSEEDWPDLILEGDRLLAAKAAEEAKRRQAWSPPTEREPLTEDKVGPWKAITWLGRGRAISSVEWKKIRIDNGGEWSPEEREAIDWGWRQLYGALRAGKIVATGQPVDENGRITIPKIYFDDKIRLTIDDKDGLEGDPIVWWGDEDHGSRHPGEIRRYDYVKMDSVAVEKVGDRSSIKKHGGGPKPKYDTRPTVRGALEIWVTRWGFDSLVAKKPGERRAIVQEKIPNDKLPRRNVLNRWIDEWIAENEPTSD
jgi:hypothetical protein